uniref:Reverse transcriptase domain-containing protein n=1 Tax=Tanacetum cinerariifolium TaxID=118510 RepID=A0A6L2M4P0_TANCI|nr:hypothetical protein [Tanacetum cinerariifolium]
MDDLNITMEEYIMLEEEKPRRHGKVYNWETITYGKIWCDEDVHDLISIETEFPDIVFNDTLTSEVALSCEPTVSPLNDNQNDFRISFDESDDEDYTERGFGSLSCSTGTNLRDHVKSILTIIELDSYPIRCMGSSQYAVSTGQNRTLIKEKDPWSFTLPYFINNVFFNNSLANLGASVCVMPPLTYLNLGLGELAHTKLTVELAYRTVKYPKGIAENIPVGIGKFVFLTDSIILDMPEDIKVTLLLGRPFLFTAHAKIDVFKRKITLRVGEEKIIFKSVNAASSLIKRVYMLSLRERMELYLEARLMGETLVLNGSLDPLNRDYIELNDLNVPLELRRDQVDDLMLTIDEGEVVEEFRTMNDARMVSKFLDILVVATTIRRSVLIVPTT